MIHVSATAPVGVAPHSRRRCESDHADHDHAPAAHDVGDLTAEGEQRRKGEQVAVDDPLRPGGRKRQLLLRLGIAMATIV